MLPECHCEPREYPFWCERHKARKTPHWVRLCQTRPDYFRAWEEGRGPGQNQNPDLRIIQMTVRENWQDVERRTSAALQSTYDVHSISLVRPNRAKLWDSLRKHKPHIVISHALAMNGKDFVETAKSHPNVAFVGMNHSTLNHTLTWPEHFWDERIILEASNEVSNLWYASPDAWCPWADLGYERFREWPNPVYLPPYSVPPRIEPCLAIASRTDRMKAIPAQIAAAALIQRQRGCRVVLNLRDRNGQAHAGLLEHAKTCGLQFDEPPWSGPDEWLAFLRDRVSVLLQATGTDTFNYCSVDALSVGRPFIGSHAIRHTPPEWRVDNCNDAHEIAKVATRVLDSYEVESAKARPLAERVAAENNQAYVAVMKEIVGRRTAVPMVPGRDGTKAGCGGCGERKLAKMAWDLTKSLAAFAGDGFRLVDADEYAERLGICDACEHRTGQRCGSCGCFIVLKAKGRAWACPEGKWGKGRESTDSAELIQGEK